ncbi:MAG TPA: ABC transporter transmembrane domain-containing protein, partial [Herpetosiphonaceae bacterium]|nr:ABC transporter transmembrane domain-containing protein [Herpetosiphonaceae bacterium]
MMIRERPSQSTRAVEGVRPCARGKFLFVGYEKLYVRGVTYGTFRPNEEGQEYPCPEVVERDFAQMAANGLNAVRTYTVPPRWLLDIAQRHGLYVMVGLPWEQHVAFLDDKQRTRSIEERVRVGVRTCANHPAVLCYTVGNEIPASIVRWYGARRVEAFLERLYRAAKAEDPESLVTYVNYPSTEYLQLPFVDIVCFNVYLESQDCLDSYLARLQNIAGDRPLVMAEIGLDSRRNGEEAHSYALEWQVRTAFAAGCAGAFVFAWTDEWHRGGQDIDDWDFGLTDRNRRPKEALAAVRQAFANVPFPPTLRWPRISVVVCSYNGARTIRSCLEGLKKLEYPNFEVIVVDDGSTDATAAIASNYDFRLIRTENRGLSSARNTGMEAATGEIIAYLDDDACPDPHWLTYLAATFISTDYVGVGGPNIAPAGDGLIAECVDNAPGNPVHVLISDREADHIPGCNMAVRREALRAIGGFDPQYRIAGDDVDVCWRLQQQGGTLGFNPAAMVWHHRRSSVRAYWKQQKNYGKAEAMLERKWAEKYNALGHLSWTGRVYGKGLTRALGCVGRIYHGIWGTAPFQGLYQPEPDTLRSLPLMPEWYLVVLALAALSALGALWTPLLFVLPLLVLAVGALLVQAGMSAAQASFAQEESGARLSRMDTVKRRGLTAFLHLLQPLARLWGHVSYGLTPWRRRGERGFALPRPRASTIWSKKWKAPEAWLHSIEAALRASGAYVLHGGDYDRWELEARGGLLGGARTRMAVEEHGTGKQLIRLRSWPRCSPIGIVLMLLFAALAIGAAFDQALIAAGVLGIVATTLTFRMFRECAGATAAVLAALRACANTSASVLRVSEQPGIATGRVAVVMQTHLTLVRRLLAQAQPYWPHVGAIFLVNLLSIPLVLLTPLPLKIVVDSVVGSHPVPDFLEALLRAAPTARDTALLAVVAALLVSIALIAQLRRLAALLLSTYTGHKLVLSFRVRLFHHVQRLSLANHNANGTRDAAYSIHYDASSIQRIVVDGVIPFITAGLMFTAMTFAITYIDWHLALVALTIAVLLFLITRFYHRLLRRRYSTVKGHETTYLSVVQEILAAAQYVTVFGQEEHDQDHFIRRSSTDTHEPMRLVVFQGVFQVFATLTIAAGTATIIFLGVRRIGMGVVTLGELLVVAIYLAQLYVPLRTISAKAGDIKASLARAKRAFSLFDEAPDVTEQPNAADLRRAQGAVTFRHVSFACGNQRPLLQDISFDIRPGTRVSIDGLTSTSKTALANLLTRFSDPSWGQILLDGVDLRDYKLAGLRNQLAIVSQEPVLFSTSIGENIVYARPNASQEEIVAAAKAANAHEFIANLPEGYQTRVGEEGMGLSGDERLRIALARAYLQDAPVLILHESARSASAETEAGLTETIEQLMRDRTTFIIGHRPGRLDNCDAWLRFNRGRLVDAQFPAPDVARNGHASGGDETTRPGIEAQSSGIQAMRSSSWPRYRRLLRYMAPYWKGRALMVLMTLLSIAFSLLQPWPMKILVDHVFGNTPMPGTLAQMLALLPGAGTSEGLLAWTVLAGLAIFAANSAMDVVLTVSWLRVSQPMVYDLARDLFAHMQRRSLLFHSRNSVGDLLSRVTGDSWCIQGVVNGLIFTPAYALITIVSMVVLMTHLHAGFTLLALAIAPLLALSSLLSGRRIRAKAQEGRKIQSRIHSHIHQTLSGIPVVQAFTREDWEQRRFRDFKGEAIRNAQRSAMTGSLSRLASGLSVTLGQATILGLGAHQVLNGNLSIGGLLVFLSYLKTLQGKMKELAGAYSGLQESSASVERVMDVLEAEPEVRDRPGAGPLPAARGHVSFEHVTFGYEPDRPVLHDVSLEALPG